MSVKPSDSRMRRASGTSSQLWSVLKLSVRGLSPLYVQPSSEEINSGLTQTLCLDRVRCTSAASSSLAAGDTSVAFPLPLRSSCRIVDCWTNSGRLTGTLLVTSLGLETFLGMNIKAMMTKRGRNGAPPQTGRSPLFNTHGVDRTLVC